MSINGLFGANLYRDKQNAGGATSDTDGGGFAAALAERTREVQQARENAAEQAAASAPSTSSSGASTTSTSGATGASSSGSTSTVALGADAQGLSGLAAAGVTVTVQPIAGLNLPLGLNPSSPTYQQDLMKALQASGQSGSDTLSQSTFDSLIEKFGGTQAQADQLFSLLGGNETGTVSNAQMLHALGNISSDPSSQTSQMLLSLMDTNHNRVVSSTEFTQFETSMVDEERATTVTG